MAHPIKLWNGSTWTDYRNGKMWDGTKWIPLQGKILASNGSWEKIGVEQKVLTLTAGWTASFYQVAMGGKNLPGSAYGNDIVAGYDKRYDDDSKIRVGDLAIIKNSASRYQTGERMDSWVHGQTIKVIQERKYRGKRALLASSQKVYSWIYEQDLTKVKKANPYGYRQAMVAWDLDVARKAISGGKLLKVELDLHPISMSNGKVITMSSHTKKSRPGKWTDGDQDLNKVGKFTWAGDKWYTLPLASGQYLLRNGCYGLSFRSSKSTNNPISFHGVRTNWPPQLRFTYEK